MIGVVGGVVVTGTVGVGVGVGVEGPEGVVIGGPYMGNMDIGASNGRPSSDSTAIDATLRARCPVARPSSLYHFQFQCIVMPLSKST
jgi:hypothetical protein